MAPEIMEALRESGHLNGCGPGSWKHEIPTPGCSGCCDEHDAAYFVGGSESDRRSADRSLYECIKKRARGRWFGARALAWVEAWAFYRAVRLEGSQYFHYGVPRTLADLRKEP